MTMFGTIPTLNTLPSVNTVQPLSRIEPLYRLPQIKQIPTLNGRQFYKSYNPNTKEVYRSPFAIDSLSDVLLNKEGKRRLAAKYGVDTDNLLGGISGTLIAGVNYIKDSYLTPIVQGEPTTFLFNAYSSLMEDVDVFANITKGAIIEADSEIPSLVVGGIAAIAAGVAVVASGGTALGAIGAGLVASGVSATATAFHHDYDAAARGVMRGIGLGDEGKYYYEFNTNNVFLNILGEVAVDPLNWLSFSQKLVIGAAKRSGYNLAKTHLKTLVRLGELDDIVSKGMFFANPIGVTFKATTMGFKWGRSTAYKAFSSVMNDYKGNMLNYDFMAINDVVNTGFKKLKEFASDVRKRSMYLDYIKGNDQEIAVASRQLMALLHKKGMSSTEAMETVRQFLELNLQGDFFAARKLLPGNMGDQAVLASIVENVLGVKYADALKIYRSNSDVVPKEVSEYILGIMDMAVKFDEVYTTVRADLSGAIHKFNNSKKTKRALLEQIDEMYRGIVDRFPSFADDPDLINNAPYIKHVLSGIFEDSTSGINLDQFMAYARAVRGNGGKVLNDFPETFGEALTNIPRGTSSDLKGALSELAEMAKISVGTDIATENFYLFTQRVKKSGPQHALKDSLPSNVKLVPRIHEMANPVHVQATLQESVAIKWLSNYESMRSINNTLDYLRNSDGDPKALQDYLGAKLSADDASDLIVFIKSYEDLRIVVQELKSMEPKGPGYSSALKRYAELHQKIMVYADSKLPELLADTSQPRVFTELLMELLVNRPEWGLFSRATLELSQKKNVYLLTMNKVRQTHFIMESVLNSDLMKLMDEISDPNSPIAMLMYRLSDANFAGLGALAKTQEDVAYVYHVVQSFRNYLNLYTEMQNLHNIKLYYSPNGELVRNMTSPYSYIIKDGRLILEPISDVSSVLGKETETIVTDIASLRLVEEATYGPELALARKLFNDEDISLDFIKKQENAMFTYQKLYNETSKELYSVEKQLDALVGDKRITEALGETREVRIEKLGSQIEEYNRQIKQYNDEIKALKSDLETIKKIVESEIEVENHKVQARRSRLVSAYVRKMFEGDASINWDQQRIMRSNLETIRASSFTDGLNNEIVDAAREFKHTIGTRLNLYANSPSEKSLRLADFANKPENIKLKIKRDIMGTLPDGSVAGKGVYGKGTVVTKVDDVLMPSVSTHVDLALIQNHLELNYGASAKLTRDELQQVVKLVNDGQGVKSAVRQVLDGNPKYTQANNVMSSQSVRGRYFSVNTPKDPSFPSKRPNSPFSKNFDTPESYMGRMFFESDEEYLKALGARDEQIKWISENKGEIMPKRLRYAELTNAKGKQRLVRIFDDYGNISPQPEHLVEVVERKTKMSNTGTFRKAEKYNQDITRLKTKLSKTTDAAEKVQLEKTIKAITEEYDAYSADQQKVIKDKAELMWSFFSKAFYDKVKDKKRGKFMREMFFDHDNIETSAWVEYNLSNTLRKFYRLVSPDGDVEFNKAMNDVRRRLGLVSDSAVYEASRSVKPISEKAIKAETVSVYTEYVARNPKIRDLLLYGDADLVAETLGTSAELTEVAKRLKILFPERRIKLQGYNVINAPTDKIVWDARDITNYIASTGAENGSFYRMFKDLLVHNKDIVEVELRFDGRPYQDSKQVLEQVRAIQAQRHSSKSSADVVKSSRPLKVTIIGPDGKVFVDTSDNTATSSFYFHSKEMQTRFNAKKGAKYPDALLDERYISPDFKPRGVKLESRLSDPKQTLRSGNSRLDALFDGVLDPTDDSIRQGMLSLYENDMRKFHALQDKMQLEAPGYERKDYGAFLGFVNRKDKISEIDGYPRQTNKVYRDIEIPQDLDLPEGLSASGVEFRVAEYNANTGRKASVKEYRGYIDTEPAKLKSGEPQDIHKIYKNETRVIHTEYGHGTVVDRLPDGRLAKDVDPTSVAVRFDAVRFEQYTRPELAKRTTLVHENDTILKVYNQARKTMKTVDGVTMDASHKRLVDRFLSGGVWDASFQKMHKIFQEETGSNMSYEEFLPKFRQTVGIYLTGEYKAGNITQEQYVRKMRKTFGKDIIKDHDLDDIAKVIAEDNGERTLLKLILERTELVKEKPFQLPEGSELIEEVVGKGNKNKVVYEIKNHVMLVRPERTVHRANGINGKEPQLFTPKAFASHQKRLTQMGQDSGAIPVAPLDSVVESEEVLSNLSFTQYSKPKSKMYTASYSELETASKYYDRVDAELNVKYFNEADIAYSGKGVMRDGVNMPLRDLNADIERIANQFPEMRPYLEAMTYEEKIRFIARPHYPEGFAKIGPEKAGHMMYDATAAKESRLKRVTGSHENLINSRKSLYNRRNQIRRTVPRDLRHKPMDDSDLHNLIGKQKELTARLEELKTNFEMSKSYGTQELNQDIMGVVKSTYGDKVQVSNVHLSALREGKLSPEEFVAKINQSDGLKAADGSVFGLTYQARQSLNLVDSKLHNDPIAPKEHIQALLNIGYDALEKIRQTHPLDAIEKLTREDLIQMFLKIKIARDYPELAEYVADLIMTYLKQQGELGRFGIKTIHMPDDAFAKKLTDLMQGGKFMDMVNGITEVKTQQDFMKARLEAFKDKFFRGKYVDGELVKGSTMDYLARIYETVDVTQSLFKSYYVDMSDVASSATSFNTYHSFIGLMKFSTDPSSARVISRFQQTETHVMNRFERLNDSFVRRQQQLIELGTYEDIQQQIQLDLAVMGGDNTAAIDKLTNWTIARTEVSLNDASNMNPSFADSLYNAQKHDLEFLDIARRTASMVQVYSRQAPVLTTRAGHAELARNQVGQFRNLLATEEGVDVFASMMKHNSLGGHIFISKNVIDDGFSPEGLRILREKYGIEFIEGPHDVNYFKVVNPSAGYEGLKPLGEQLTRMTPEYHPEIEKAMSELLDRLNRAVDLPHPTHWSEGSFMRWNDVSLIEYLIRQEVITEDMAGVVAEQLQRSSIMRYSMITDYEGMFEILGEYAPGSPISGIINSSISLAQHSTSKMRFADLFIREDYRVDRILGTTNAEDAYAKFRAIPGLKAVMLTNEGYVVDFAIDLKDAKLGVRQMQDALNSKAILTTYSGFTELYRKLDSFEAPKVLDWVDRNVTSAFKAGYMTSVGLPIRNLLDNNIRLLMLAEGDFRALGYIPKAHRYIDRFTEMALEMGNLKNYEEALEYLKTRSAEDLEIYRMMMVAVEAKVSGAPLKEVVDIANATRGGADFIVDNVVQGTWTQRIAWGNPLTKAALEMQGWGEERYRLAAFLFMLEKGSGSMEAVERIAEFFIDYSHKGHGMKTLQTLVPFGLFAVKNLQMWADHALDSPDLFRMMLDVFNTQAADAEYASKKAPSEYQMSQRLSGNKTVGGTLYKLNPSLYDAMNIIPGIFGDPLQRTSPVIKNIAALLSGDPDSIELPFETPIKRVGDILTKTLPDVMKGNTKQIPNLMPSLMSYREPFGTTTRGQYSPGVRSYNRVTGYSTDKMSARYGGRIPRSSFYVRKSYLDRGFYSKLYTASGESRIKIRQSKPTHRNLAARIRDQNYKFK